MSLLTKGFAAAVRKGGGILTLDSADGWPEDFLGTSPARPEAAMKVSTVFACVEIISGNLAMLPVFIQHRDSRQHLRHPVLELLNERPNEAMTALTLRQMVEQDALCHGAGFVWIRRKGGTPVELIFLPGDIVEPVRHPDTGALGYFVSNPETGQPMILHPEDVIHVLGYSRDGLHGISVLQQARDTIHAALSAQQYERALYDNGGRPSGVLYTESPLGGYSKETGKDGKPLLLKDVLRREWDKVYTGPENAGRVAILDHGLKYQPISMSKADAQFVESKDISILDICRFFLMPPHKVGAGKQTYESNESNAIEYIQNCIQPKVTLREQELSFKLLLPSEREKGREARINMMALLRSDVDKRGQWYEAMRREGVFSVNDICALEDIPNVPGGDTRLASLNFVPLEHFEELSIARNGGEAAPEEPEG